MTKRPNRNLARRILPCPAILVVKMIVVVVVVVVVVVDALSAGFSADCQLNDLFFFDGFVARNNYPKAKNEL